MTLTILQNLVSSKKLVIRVFETPCSKPGAEVINFTQQGPWGSLRAPRFQVGVQRLGERQWLPNLPCGRIVAGEPRVTQSPCPSPGSSESQSQKGNSGIWFGKASQWFWCMARFGCHWQRWPAITWEWWALLQRPAQGWETREQGGYHGRLPRRS